MTKPTLEDLGKRASEIGLPMIEVEKFHNYYESNGWRVGRNPMKSWTHALANWKLNQERYGATNGHATKPMSIYDLKTVLAAKEQQAKTLYDRYCVEGPLVTYWEDKEHHRQYRDLKQDIRELMSRISKMA